MKGTSYLKLRFFHFRQITPPDYDVSVEGVHSPSRFDQSSFFNASVISPGRTPDHIRTEDGGIQLTPLGRKQVMVYYGVILPIGLDNLWI